MGDAPDLDGIAPDVEAALPSPLRFWLEALRELRRRASEKGGNGG